MYRGMMSVSRMVVKTDARPDCGAQGFECDQQEARRRTPTQFSHPKQWSQTHPHGTQRSYSRNLPKPTSTARMSRRRQGVSCICTWESMLLVFRQTWSAITSLSTTGKLEWTPPRMCPLFRFRQCLIRRWHPRDVMLCTLTLPVTSLTRFGRVWIGRALSMPP